jgi:hypothetical protein
MSDRRHEPASFRKDVKRYVWIAAEQIGPHLELTLAVLASLARSRAPDEIATLAPRK